MIKQDGRAIRSNANSITARTLTTKSENGIVITRERATLQSIPLL